MEVVDQLEGAAGWLTRWREPESWPKAYGPFSGKQNRRASAASSNGGEMSSQGERMRANAPAGKYLERLE
jgi:hypothetical protein